MENTSAVYAMIDTKLKENAENILSQLGVTPSAAIQMLYSQIVLTKGIPFDFSFTADEPIAVKDMTREQLDMELRKGMESLKNGKTYTVDEVDTEFLKEFGI